MAIPAPEVIAAARRVLAYLAATDPVPAAPCDAIMGFGVFDLRLPVFCGELYTRGLAPRLIFSGGRGAGSGRLPGSEAEAWRTALRARYPDIPDSAILLEDRSTNTAENLAFTGDLLARTQPELAFGRGLRRLIIVASPSRLRRVGLTLRRAHPEIEIVRQLPPPVSLESEWAAYGLQGIDYRAHLIGELDRLVDYPQRGWIAEEPLPPEIAAAHTVLRGQG